MARALLSLRGLALIAIATTLTACNKNSADATDTNLVIPNEIAAVLPESDSSENALSAVVGASEIPYPVYPNGTKYRVGGENGLKIVVFQTEDPFHKVDDYYNGMSDNSGMARIMAMTDYVRYSNDSNDVDPWATHLPGIVIHEFEGEEDRQAVGASAMAKTNIIMSF